MLLLLVTLMLFGHAAICVATINRMHGTGLPRWFLHMTDVLWGLFAVGIPCLIAISVWQAQWSGPLATWLPPAGSFWHRAVQGYLVLTLGSAVVAVAQWSYRRWLVPTTHRLTTNHTKTVNVQDQCDVPLASHVVTRLAAKLPFNEILTLSIHEKNLRLPRLPESLDGLQIAHLSDLHFTGHIDRRFFTEVVDQTNALRADLIAITGDIIDKAKCLTWIPEILGRLQAPQGVFYVLGNHELRVKDEPAVRQALQSAGLVDMGDHWRVLDLPGGSLLLAGNERPWYRRVAEMKDAPRFTPGGDPLFRVLLTHTPDQLPWARRHGFDLMLAGHTHGGQVRFPVIGPVLAPSLYGVRHASGTFFESPTLLHVSRGISGTRPLRVNCAPEVAKLVLRCESTR
ncbi:MAG: metallophosphoesterase [Planctomycetales bacterium]|nr:metallophosphoesterase [Planctomycetales bacterium]